MWSSGVETIGHRIFGIRHPQCLKWQPVYASAFQNLEGTLLCCLAPFIGRTGIAFLLLLQVNPAVAEGDKGRVFGESTSVYRVN